MTDYTQYRVTSPDGLEEFYSSRGAAQQHFDSAQEATLWRANESTNHKWVEIASKPGPKALRDLLNLDF